MSVPRLRNYEGPRRRPIHSAFFLLGSVYSGAVIPLRLGVFAEDLVPHELCATPLARRRNPARLRRDDPRRVFCLRRLRTGPGGFRCRARCSCPAPPGSLDGTRSSYRRRSDDRPTIDAAFPDFRRGQASCRRSGMERAYKVFYAAKMQKQKKVSSAEPLQLLAYPGKSKVLS